jgi:hypothetical protein
MKIKNSPLDFEFFRYASKFKIVGSARLKSLSLFREVDCKK